jgi:hypothetical protein
MDAPVAKDIECADDLAAALQLKGLEYRKKILELIQFGCVQVMPQGYKVTSPLPLDKSKASKRLLEGGWFDGLFTSPLFDFDGKSFTGITNISFLKDGESLVPEKVGSGSVN